MNEYQPDYCSHPGETLKELLDDMNMSLGVLDEHLNIGLRRLHQILDGQASITNIAERLELIFNIPANFWRRRQEQYDQCIARIKDL